MSTLRAINENFRLDSLKPAFQSITTSPFTNKSIKEVLVHFSESDLILFILKSRGISFFNTKDIESLTEIYQLAQQTDNAELECRIYSYTKPKKGKATSINIQRGLFFYMLNYCWKTFSMDNLQNTIDVVRNDFSKNKVRSTYSSIKNIYDKKSEINISKVKVKEYSLTPTDYTKKMYNNINMKLSLSTEEPMDSVIGLKSQLTNKIVSNLIRIKSRHSFKVNDLWRIDCTRVKMSYSIQDVLDKNELYEFECEFIGPKTTPLQLFIQSLNDIYILLLSNSGYC
jgi:hypothetical protein